MWSRNHLEFTANIRKMESRQCLSEESQGQVPVFVFAYARLSQGGNKREVMVVT